METQDIQLYSNLSEAFPGYRGEDISLNDFFCNIWDHLTWNDISPSYNDRKHPKDEGRVRLSKGKIRCSEIKDRMGQLKGETVSILRFYEKQGVASLGKEDGKLYFTIKAKGRILLMKNRHQEILKNLPLSIVSGLSEFDQIKEESVGFIKWDGSVAEWTDQGSASSLSLIVVMASEFLSNHIDFIKKGP